jgi:phosphoribosylamine--glycine ligase/phosphoribosylformylglycinamidine cyclo-ligase
VDWQPERVCFLFDTLVLLLTFAGVIIPKTKQEAYNALKVIMLDKEFDSAGDEVVIEEFLEGDELSILSFSDGYTMQSLPPAQDHKRIFDGDEGPNTGGMGCYAPTKIATKSLIAEIEQKVLQPTIDGMRKERFPFIGTLFTGLMITKSGPKCLEYNVRFGDPETQTLLPLMSKDTDLAEIMIACTEGWLDTLSVKVDAKSSATVVVAAGGYPGPYAKGTHMSVESPSTDTNIFHAGTIIKDGQLQTSGGRVIAAQATAGTLEEAVKKAYTGVNCIKFNEMFYRKDIAHRAFKLTNTSREAMTYASSGVSVDGGNQFVERIKKAVASTARAGASAVIGGFAGEIDLARAGYTSAPVVVLAVDGVGTKLAIAHTMNQHDTVGIDLVAMNTNDLLCDGTVPLAVVDYIGCSELDQETFASFVEGVAKGCSDSNAALVGGETAEMPGMYKNGEYDAAAAAMGARYPDEKLPNLDLMVEGDILLGLASNGIHSNGFSLVRKIINHADLDYEKAAPWDNTKSVGESLLTPTRIYVKPVVSLFPKKLLKGLVHITGGGFTENIPRALPSTLAAEVDVGAWEHPGVFKWLQNAGNVDSAEMAKTFNNGIGMIAIVSKENAEQVQTELEASGEKVYRIGALVPRADSEKGCVLKNLSTWDKNRE